MPKDEPTETIEFTGTELAVLSDAMREHIKHATRQPAFDSHRSAQRKIEDAYADYSASRYGYDPRLDPEG